MRRYPAACRGVFHFAPRFLAERPDVRRGGVRFESGAVHQKTSCVSERFFAWILYMPFVYILYSESRNRYYIGSTDDPVRRLNEHNRGKTPSTKPGIPWRLVLTHEVDTLSAARQIEYKVKNLKRRDYLLKMISDGVIRIR